MTTTTFLAASLGLLTGACAAADSVPEAMIGNGLIRARLFLPDPKTGFYRGTRFDWSGVIGGLEYSGHDYFPAWFQRTNGNVHDFVYEGEEIVAGPCTAITGPSEEFVTNGQALGFADAKAGETFVKIGVGLLRKPSDAPYDMFHLYDLVDGGKWTITKAPQSIEFVQVLADRPSGYAYEYQKIVSLTPDRSQMVLDHRLRNTGQRDIQTSVYNHNFLYLDRKPPGPGVSIALPFEIRTPEPFHSDLAQIQSNRIVFTKTLSGNDRVYTGISGFGGSSNDYDIRIENEPIGAGVRITADRPLSRAALWTIRAPLSFEPFIDMHIAPGSEFHWQIKYDFYTLQRAAK